MDAKEGKGFDGFEYCEPASRQTFGSQARKKKGDALNKIRVIKVKIMKVTFLSRESVT